MAVGVAVGGAGVDVGVGAVVDVAEDAGARRVGAAVGETPNVACGEETEGRAQPRAITHNTRTAPNLAAIASFLIGLASLGSP